jgi:predicted CXXCH cytochrome family protein
MLQHVRAISLMCVLMAMSAFAQDVLGTHDLSPTGQSPLKGTLSNACLYCHAPHSGQSVKLWNQTLSSTPYTPYTSTTDNQTKQSKRLAPLGSDSSMCLSCHDGTIAPGETTAYGSLTMTGTTNAQDFFTEGSANALERSHPFSLDLPIQDSPDLVSTLASGGTTKQPSAVKLISGNIECTSCHNPHIQSIDKVVPKFLVQDSSAAQMCLACHDPTRSSAGQTNPLSGWSTSIHATATNSVLNQADVYLGGYGTVAANACNSCHASHDAGGQARLLRGVNEQACLSCHSGGTNVNPTPPNIFGEYLKASQPGGSGHPFSSGTSVHEATEPVLLNLNRHATCVDCHNPHSAQMTTTFTASGVRPSQDGVSGIDFDGTTVVSPAVDPTQICLRCHGTSTGKPSVSAYGYLPTRLVAAVDPFNVIPEFSSTATSSHPVFQGPTSALPQPSLRAYMLNEDGTANSGRPLNGKILCTDCHSSDDSREFGGNGPAGPHGSIYPHILERQYVMSRVADGAAPGTTIVNLQLSPDLSPKGTYALCAKCHDLSNIVSTTSSFPDHARHINDGFSCSVCHTAHGIGASSGNLSGERLVDFDVNVVAPNVQNGVVTPISYNRAASTPSATCTLTCHGHVHN